MKFSHSAPYFHQANSFSLFHHIYYLCPLRRYIHYILFCARGCTAVDHDVCLAKNKMTSSMIYCIDYYKTEAQKLKLNLKYNKKFKYETKTRQSKRFKYHDLYFDLSAHVHYLMLQRSMRSVSETSVTYYQYHASVSAKLQYWFMPAVVFYNCRDA